MSDTEKLRSELKEDSLGAFFAGGFGGAMAEYSAADKASPAELDRMAELRGIKKK